MAKVTVNHPEVRPTYTLELTEDEALAVHKALCTTGDGYHVAVYSGLDEVLKDTDALPRVKPTPEADEALEAHRVGRPTIAEFRNEHYGREPNHLEEFRGYTWCELCQVFVIN